MIRKTIRDYEIDLIDAMRGIVMRADLATLDRIIHRRMREVMKDNPDRASDEGWIA